MKLHIFRLSGHDFVHYRKIEIGANDRAVYQQSISCFIVYANFDWFLINLTAILFCLIMFVDWFVQYKFQRESNNLRRLVTGFVCGYAFGNFIMKYLRYFM